MLVFQRPVWQRRSPEGKVIEVRQKLRIRFVLYLRDTQLLVEKAEGHFQDIFQRSFRNCPLCLFYLSFWKICILLLTRYDSL